MNDTPRTEAEVNRPHGPLDGIVTVDADFACQLERELNRACEMYRKLDIHALNLVDMIMRLEKAGDTVEKKLGCGCGCYGLCKACQSASDNWIKAKEAKP
jgi:hypothetical protein